MGEYRRLRPCLQDDLSCVIKGEVFNMIVASQRLCPEDVDDEAIRVVVVRKAVEELRVGDKPDGLVEVKDKPVRLHRVAMPDRCAEGDIFDRVLTFFLKQGDCLKMAADVLEHDSVLSNSIFWAEKYPPLFEAALGHGLNEDVDVICVVEVLVGEYDAVKAGKVGPPFCCVDTHQCARAGIDVEVCFFIMEPKAPCCPQLL